MITKHVALLAVLCLTLNFSFAFANPLSNLYIKNGNSLVEPRELGKRSPADAKFSSQRSERLADLRRKYTLLAILENMKGKRADNENTENHYPLNSNGDIDYQAILDALNKQADPWFLVDSKRDIFDDDFQNSFMIFNDNVPSLKKLYREKSASRLDEMFPYNIKT